MKFSDFSYERLDMKKLKEDFSAYFKDFENASSFEVQDEIMSKINALRNHCESMMSIGGIRHTINTKDEFYEKENDFIDEISPVYEGLISDYYKILVNSKFKLELEAKWGPQIFRIAELQMKTFSNEVIEDMQKENKLTSEYDKLKASAAIMFEGEERNLSQMGPFMISKDRNMRIKAQTAVTKFYVENEEKFDSIYHDLVQLRHSIAQKLGFNNFVELAYARLTRSDYDAKFVKNYRKQVLESIVPLARELRKRQAKRLKVDKLKYYDQGLEFLTGNASPKGDAKWILEQGKKMYSELSDETNDFFKFMVSNELLDLETKPGKSGGGYCDYIAKYKSPFIFSNFNGTSGDVDVLTHEAGHAFQVYSSSKFEVPEYNWPTYEAAEIHSMSMEFFAWPWMELFFKEDVTKYKFSHLSGALLFIPYGVTVDEFQHWVYENPTATPAERKTAWRNIEKKYLPDLDYDGNDFLERGGYWFRQAHIFASPFYYIDYTLAQVSAFEFWGKANVDKKTAWKDYTTLCNAGGSKSYLGLLKLANLQNPFVDGTIKEIMKPVSKFLSEIDDENL